MRSLLLEYEQLEADILSTDECWPPSCSAPELTSDIWVKMMELQAKRNLILHAPEPEQLSLFAQ